MKAAILKANGVLTIDDVPQKKLAEDECLIKVHAVGVCSSDIARGFGGKAYHYPLVMGHELAGEVVERGSDAMQLNTGTRVAVFPLLPCRDCPACHEQQYARCRQYGYYGSRQDGGFSQYLAVKTWNLIPLPASVSFANAAALEPLSVVLHALTQFDLSRECQELIVIGSGFLGLIAVRLLARFHPQIKITVIDRNEFKLKLARECGATTQLLDGAADWDNYLKTNTGRFARVLESCGTPLTFRHSLNLARQGGEVVWMGNISADLVLPQNEVSLMLRKELRLLGTWNSQYLGKNPSDWTKACDLLANGLNLEDLLTHRIGLEELPGILKRLHDHKCRRENFETIKVMVFP